MTFTDNFIATAVQLGPQGIHAINEGLTYTHAERVIRPGDTVFDLGGNRGDLAAPFASWVGNSGIVHVFEPNPDHWPGLLAIANVRLWPFAAGDALALQCLSVPEGLDGWASLNDLSTALPDTTLVRRSTLTVPISSLEEVCRSLPTFVKIDVEGFEFQALKGLKAIICKARPVILFETWTGDIKALFDTIDYEVYDLFGRPSDGNITGIPNQVALPRERSVTDVVACGAAEMGLLARARVLD